MNLSPRLYAQLVDSIGLRDSVRSETFRSNEFCVVEFDSADLTKLGIPGNYNIACYKGKTILWYSDFDKKENEIGYYQVEFFSDDKKSVILYSFYGGQFIVELETGKCAYYGWHK